MSLLDFFADQRRQWLQQPTPQAPEYLVGGLVALDQAEAVFRATPLLNAHHQMLLLRQEMDLLRHRLSNEQAQQTLLREQLAKALIKRAKASNRYRVARDFVRKLLHLVQDLTQADRAMLDVMTEILTGILSDLPPEVEPADAPETPTPTLPLPE